MAEQTDALMQQARDLGLFKPHAPFEVHCSECHARLGTSGDCPNCGVIGRSEAEVSARGQKDPAALEKMLQTQIARRRAYRPVKTAGREG